MNLKKFRSKKGVGSFVILERIIWFDEQIKKDKYPNASDIAKHFEVSKKTAQRTVDFMRDRICLPLQYDSSMKGYSYTYEKI